MSADLDTIDVTFRAPALEVFDTKLAKRARKLGCAAARCRLCPASRRPVGWGARL